MDFVILPYQAVMLLFSTLCGIGGAIYFRKYGKVTGFVLGIVISTVIAMLLKSLVPVKLTTNTAQYNKQSNDLIMERHAKPLPPRVTNERLSFEEELALKNEALRKRGELK